MKAAKFEQSLTKCARGYPAAPVKVEAGRELARSVAPPRSLFKDLNLDLRRFGSLHSAWPAIQLIVLPNIGMLQEKRPMTNSPASRSTEIVTAALATCAQISVKSKRTLAEKSKRVPDASSRSKKHDGPRTTWRSNSSCREATVDVSSGKTTRGVHR